MSSESAPSPSHGLNFSVNGIPVSVRGSFFIGTAILGFRGSAAGVVQWMACCFISILIHELGHALAVRAYGGSPSIELHAMGGLTSWSTAGVATLPRQRLLISLAGPGAELVFAALLFAMRGLVVRYPLAKEIYDELLWINIVWPIFNLIPMLPLDGGNALESLVAMRWPSRARSVAEIATLVAGSAILVLAAITGSFWPGFIAAFSVMPVIVAMRDRRRVAIETEFAPRLKELRVLRNRGDLPATLALGAELLVAARAPSLKRSVATELVLANFDARNTEAALALYRTHFRDGEIPDAVWLARSVAENGPKAMFERLETESIATESSDVIALFIDASVALDATDRCIAVLRNHRSRIAALGAVYFRTATHFYQARYDEALAVCEIGVLVWEDPVFAFNAACSLARLDRLDEGFAALERAVELGYGQPTQFDDDPDLAAYRSDPRWAEFLAMRANRAST